MTPLTVIGGFLGAGKTTLLNHVLRTALVRFGVLVNDFGAINIDAALIATRDGDTIALTNGCVCCEIGTDLGAGLLRMASKGVDHVVIEASGVSDPWRVAQLALVEDGFSLEPIVVLVDARALTSQLADRWVADTVRGQVRAAEILVLNKADPATKALADARGALRGLGVAAPMIETAYGAVDLEALRFTPPPRSSWRADSPSAHSFPTCLITPPASFDRLRLRAALAGLPGAVLRVKGFCRLGDAAEAHLLQYAAGQWALTPVATAAPLGLVVIGTPEMPACEALAAVFAAAGL